jgi:hypothetical protein
MSSLGDAARWVTLRARRVTANILFCGAQLAAAATCACVLPPPALHTTAALAAGLLHRGACELAVGGCCGRVWRCSRALVLAASAVLPGCWPRTLLHSAAGLGATLPTVSRRLRTHG